MSLGILDMRLAPLVMNLSAHSNIVNLPHRICKSALMTKAFRNTAEHIVGMIAELLCSTQMEILESGLNTPI